MSSRIILHDNIFLALAAWIANGVSFRRNYRLCYLYMQFALVEMRWKDIARRKRGGGFFPQKNKTNSSLSLDRPYSYLRWTLSSSAHEALWLTIREPGNARGQGLIWNERKKRHEHLQTGLSVCHSLYQWYTYLPFLTFDQAPQSLCPPWQPREISAIKTVLIPS